MIVLNLLTSSGRYFAYFYDFLCIHHICKKPVLLSKSAWLIYLFLHLVQLKMSFSLILNRIIRATMTNNPSLMKKYNPKQHKYKKATLYKISKNQVYKRKS